MAEEPPLQPLRPDRCRPRFCGGSADRFLCSFGVGRDGQGMLLVFTVPVSTQVG